MYFKFVFVVVMWSKDCLFGVWEFMLSFCFFRMVLVFVKVFFVIVEKSNVLGLNEMCLWVCGFFLLNLLEFWEFIELEFKLGLLCGDRWFLIFLVG